MVTQDSLKENNICLPITLYIFDLD